MFESTFSRPIGFFRRFRCKRLKMVGLGRLAGLRPMEQTIRSSMFQYASGATYWGLAGKAVAQFCGEEARVPGWRGPIKRDGTALRGIYPATDGPRGQASQMATLTKWPT